MHLHFHAHRRVFRRVESSDHLLREQEAAHTERQASHASSKQLERRSTLFIIISSELENEFGRERIQNEVDQEEIEEGIVYLVV